VAHLHIIREHSLGLEQARKIAFAWAEQVEQEFGMDCVYEEDVDSDVVNFTRSGVVGTLQVSGNKFELDARLGFLLGAFKDRIESEIVKNLDQLLQPKATPKTADKVSGKTAVKTAAAKSPAKSAAKTTGTAPAKSAKTTEKTGVKTAEKVETKKKVAKKSST
jgi:putative polyhydroxyalkanoate system protein